MRCNCPDDRTIRCELALLVDWNLGGIAMTSSSGSDRRKMRGV